MNLLPAGRDAVLVEVGSSHAAVSLASWARARHLARDVVPGAETVLLDGIADRAALDEVLASWEPEPAAVGPVVEVAVTYDGPDLAFVAELWRCPVDDVVARHQTASWESAFCGFAPGFSYLVATERDLPEVPRLATPRTRVPAGSVALAGRWCGIYPGESPGGWRVIGRTDATLWDPDLESPALLAPGTRVSFVAVP